MQLARVVQRSAAAVASAILAAVLLAGCTARGGGYLPPDGYLFSGQASLGFTVSCERSSESTSTNAPTGQLRIEIAYVDHGVNPLGESFGIHGIADEIQGISDELDQYLESAACIGENPPPGGHELIFLGRYRLVSSPPAAFPTACAVKDWTTGSNCRFEVIVRDNDLDRAPSKGDWFSIKLSNVTELTTQFQDPSTVFYIRTGVLAGGNLTVD